MKMIGILYVSNEKVLMYILIDNSYFLKIIRILKILCHYEITGYKLLFLSTKINNIIYW